MISIPNEQRIIELLTEYIIKADKYFDRTDAMDIKFNEQHEFLLEQSKRMDVMLQVLIQHSQSIEKIEQKLFGHDERIQKLESK